MSLDEINNKNQRLPCIVFIVDGYYPNYSANGICVSSIVDVLSQEYKIIIIAPRSNEQQGANTCQDDIRYYDYRDNHVRLWVEQKLNSSRRMKKILYEGLKKNVQAYSVIKILAGKTSINHQKTKGVLKELESINEKIEAIIPVCLPFESIIAATEYKSKCLDHVKVMPFLLDKFSENPTLHRTVKNRNRKYKRHLSIEKDVFNKCDWLLYIGSWEKQLYKYFLEFEKKFCRVEIPLLRQITTNERVVYDNEKINIVYTGHLYKEIRSPEYALMVLSKVVEKNKSVVIHFYIRGNCGLIVNSYCKKYPENIINHGLVPTEVAKAAMVSADILLSIGNKNVTDLPSKTFEYISTGKPILHYYFNKEDPVNAILNQYENSYCSEIDELQKEQAESIILDLIKKPSKTIEFREVEKIFYSATPEFTANKVAHCISGNVVLEHKNI